MDEGVGEGRLGFPMGRGDAEEVDWGDWGRGEGGVLECTLEPCMFI